VARIIRRDEDQRGRQAARIRYVTRTRTTTFDHFVADLVEQRGFGHERFYFGIETEEGARLVRRGLRRGAAHLGVSIRSFWEACSGCDLGGDECRYHVRFAAFTPEEARRYGRRKGAAAAKKRAQGRRQ
jgi:hypothetical protein